MSKLTIRLAEESDNEGIVDLARRCPQKGMITFRFHRWPRFNSINRLLDPRAWHLVACEGQQIVGVIGAIYYDAQLQGQPVRVGFVLDFLLDERLRGLTAAFRLIKEIVARLYASDADIVLMNFLKDNPSPMVFAKGRARFPAALPLGENTFYNILPLRNKSLSGLYEIGTANSSDVPQLIDLYQRQAQRYKLAETVSQVRLEHFWKNIQGLSLENFLVARSGERIRAVTATWDEDGYRAYEVLKLNLPLTMVNWGLHLISRLYRGPQPIRLNQPLRQLSLVLSAHDESPQAMLDLFKHVNNAQRGSQYTLLTMYAQNHDPLLKIARQLKGIAVASEMYAFARTEQLGQRLANHESAVQFNLALLQ